MGRWRRMLAIAAMMATVTVSAPGGPAGAAEGQGGKTGGALDDLKPLVDWAKATESPAYAKATAGQPAYEDKALWPNLNGGEAYVQETWEQGHLLVWAFPGESGWDGRKPGDHNPIDGASWLLDGKPITGEVPFDENTDVLLPDAEKPYTVSLNAAGGKQTFRHITIGRNASLQGGGDGRGRRIYGNVWIKRGGKTGNQGATQMVGGKNTFFRNDNSESDDKGRGLMCSQYFVINCDAGGSVEFLGHVSMLDEFRIIGVCVVGPDSRVQPGRNASPAIQAGGTLALMDGAMFGSWTNNFSGPDLSCGGTIQGGLPDRPLTRSAYLMVHFKNYTQSVFDGEGAFRDRTGQAQEYPRVPSLRVSAGALRSFSKDIQQAHLVVTWIGDLGVWNVRPPPGSDAEKNQLAKTPEAAGRFQWIDSLPHRVDCHLGKGVAVDGVEFDYVHKGGIMFDDPADKAGWKNVFCGPHCEGRGEEMYSQQTLDRGGRY